MGGKCSPSGGIDPIQDENSTNIKKRQGRPNSRTDLYDGKSEIIQSRWYGENAWVIWDRDYKHNDSNNSHEFPHDHNWNWKWNNRTGKFELEPGKPQKINPNFC